MKKANAIKLVLTIAVIAIVIIVAGFVYKKIPTELTKLKVGIMQIGDCLALFVAQDEGFFREEGLEVEAIPMAGGAVIQPAVESGELDIGFTNTVSIIIAYEKGSDFKFLVPGAFKDPKSADLFRLLVSKDSDIDEPKDVEGKTVAVNTFKNIMELALKAWAEKNKVDYDKINVVEVPFPQMESALENKEIDVAFLVEPYPTLAISSGVAKVLDDRPYDALAERLMIASWFAKESWVDENSKKARAFIDAMNKAIKYIAENPAEMAEILSNNTRLTKELAGRMTMPSFFEHIMKQDFQVMIDASYKYGYIKEKFDAEELAIDGLELK